METPIQKIQYQHQISVAYYLKTNSQTKNANKIIKNYFCAYINHTQDNWVNNLLIIEFAASNHINTLTKIILLFVDHRFYPHTGINLLGIYNDK